ncbi:GntR family transcriptional regulator [Loigolactobacillus jiayinensis]|uniref:GntR family transcriptional regulator n=1 Tax=Loigolactobacillus jiayinensis TaxID=2486016 RepID=A0ABW1RA97_9LACO|nr:GntR family transcriptional regulator [Loigolactobacillus jiayinensis]
MAKAKYQAVADEIRKRILSKIYPTKTLIPDQNTLAKEFGVSRMTVKKALDGIAREGLIYKQSGLGTYVLGDISIKTANDSPADAFNGLTEQQGAERVTSDVIDFSVAFATKDLQAKLDIGANDPVYNILRLRRLEGEPFILEHTFMPVKLVPDLTLSILKSSIYDYIHHELKLKFGGAYRKIHASLPTELDIAHLNATATEPILEVEQIVWLTTGQNIEYSTSRNLFNKRSYTVLDINNI